MKYLERTRYSDFPLVRYLKKVAFRKFLITLFVSELNRCNFEIAIIVPRKTIQDIIHFQEITSVLMLTASPAVVLFIPCLLIITTA
jgi:hypothetical protein